MTKRGNHHNPLRFTAGAMALAAVLGATPAFADDKELLDALLKNGALSKEQYQNLVKASGAAGNAPSELIDILLKNGALTRDQHSELARKQTGAADNNEGSRLLEARLDKKKSELEALEARLDKKQQSFNAAENQAHKSESTVSKKDDQSPVTLDYGKKGFEVKTRDGKFSLAIQNRLQFRYATPFDRDPRSIEQLEGDASSFMVRRARTKLTGRIYWPWLSYYMQYDWAQPILRDFYLNIDKYSWAQLRVGRGKVYYNDERVSSSGSQQFVNRSIVNDIFTVDRQQGVQVFGRLFEDTWHDISYYTGVFSGLGVGERNNDDDNMMWSGRLQWNVLGGEMPFTQGDVEHHDHPALNIAFAASTNQSKCTAFETAEDSCRALPGFDIGKSGQYRLRQMMEEVRFKWQGLSFQHELHWKDVIDTHKSKFDGERETNLLGGYFQAGYFPHYIFDVIPKNLELAGRYGFVDPNRDVDNDLQQEASGVLNYYFNGHSNKLSFQVSHLTVSDPKLLLTRSDQRFWAQWDISF
jgi:phosphate-selective porin